MYCYRVEESICISNYLYEELEKISTDAAIEANLVYVLNRLEVPKSRMSFIITDPDILFIEKEGIELLDKKNTTNNELPGWLLKKIHERKVISVNTEYPKWREALKPIRPKKWRINLLGLGDVGGTLVTGLRLLGGDDIAEIGIYDRREESVKRWLFETNQILSTIEGMNHPPVKSIGLEELFDCDMFVFCASKGVPPVGEEKEDVRMVQFRGNSELIGIYANMAKEANFKGIFAVVSDPVDLLCKSVLLQSNLNPEQIRGYGLGVMNARAAYYARLNNADHYMQEGRAYGPHGDGLIIADSLENYDDELSRNLTLLAKTANLEVRKAGFKPFIAPALSSGALSILATIKGQWHYSSVFIGGVYMGCRNRLTPSSIEIERMDVPEKLMTRIRETYDELENLL